MKDNKYQMTKSSSAPNSGINIPKNKLANSLGALLRNKILQKIKSLAYVPSDDKPPPMGTESFKYYKTHGQESDSEGEDRDAIRMKKIQKGEFNLLKADYIKPYQEPDKVKTMMQKF